MIARLRDTQENNIALALPINELDDSSVFNRFVPEEDYCQEMEEAPARMFSKADEMKVALALIESSYPHKNNVNEDPKERLENKPDQEYLDQMLPKGYPDGCVYSYGMVGKIMQKRLPLKAPYEQKLEDHILKLKAKIIGKLNTYTRNGDAKKLRKY